MLAASENKGCKKASLPQKQKKKLACDGSQTNLDNCASWRAGALRLARHQVSKRSVPHHIKPSLSTIDPNIASALDTFHEHGIGTGAGATTCDNTWDI